MCVCVCVCVSEMRLPKSPRFPVSLAFGRNSISTVSAAGRFLCLLFLRRVSIKDEAFSAVYVISNRSLKIR